MKTKTSIWLSICTIVLCIGVMTFGVYSAISANLNIGGTLGFNMHDCMVTVSGTIQNVAKTTDNWATAEPYTKTIERTIMGGESTTTTNFNLDPLYFYNNQDLIFNITFTNIYTKAIDATIPIPTADGTVVTVLTGTANGYTNFTDENNTYKASIPVGSSVTVKFALHLANPDAMATELTSFSWTNITFEEAKKLVQYDEENGYYYIEMGTNPYRQDEEGNNLPLRWISFAKEQTDGTYDFFNKTSEPTSGTYYFISELVLYTDETSTLKHVGGVPFQNEYTYTSSSQVYVTGTQYQAQDYAVSKVRSYLNGGDVYNSYTYTNSVATTAGSQVNISTYGILESDIYKNNITPRSLSELYEIGSKMTTTYNCGDEADKLWLLSYTKNSTRGDSGTLSDTDSEVNWVINNYGSGGETTTYDSSAGKGTSQAYWWLRSPYASYAYNMRYVDPDFEGVLYSSACNAIGVRPAFQIQIS